jgi:hypothetical protein
MCFGCQFAGTVSLPATGIGRKRSTVTIQRQAASVLVNAPKAIQ